MNDSLSLAVSDCVSWSCVRVSIDVSVSRLILRLRDGGGEGYSARSSSLLFWLDDDVFSEDNSSSDELKSACLAVYSFVSMASSRFDLKVTFFGWGKNTLRFESRGLALTDACLGNGEFFRIDLIPKGSVNVYGSCCFGGTGLGDSVLDTGDGRIDKSHWFVSVLLVVGVYVACAVFGAIPRDKEP